MRIDIHTHILPKNIPDFKSITGESGYIILKHHETTHEADMMRDDGVFFRRIQANCFDPQTRIEEMDQLGIDVQVLSTVPVMFSFWAKPENTLKVAQFINDDLAKTVAQYPKRFTALATLPMNDISLSVKELERAVTELGLKGTQIGSHIGKLNLSDPEMFPFYEAAESLGACLLVHPWDMMGKDTMDKYWLPWLVGMPAETSRAICSMIFGGIFEKFPKLRVCFAHGGGSFPGTFGRIMHGFNVRPDLCAVDNKVSPKDSLGKFYLDSIVHDPIMLKHIIELIGIDKVILGSDYPFPLGELSPGELINSADFLDKDAKDQLFYKSALNWLGMSEKDFG